MNNTCTASHHGSTYAYRKFGCRCPGVTSRRTALQVPGTGRHSKTITHPDDDNITIALMRIRLGQPAPLLNVPECRAVVAALTAQAWSARQIALALGLAQRSVVRHRAKVRTQGTHLIRRSRAIPDRAEAA